MRRYAEADSTVLWSSPGYLRKTAGSKLASIKLSNGKTYNQPSDTIVTVTRAISARVNQNFDGFPSKELKSAAHTFVGRPVFVNHNNEDHRRTRGIIIDSAYKEAGTDKYIELLIEVDAKSFPKLASLISTGELDSVSMGTDVEFTKCSYCNNKAYEIEDFCSHVRNQKGQTLSKMGSDGKRESVLVYESCYGLNFFEISYVFDPADELAISSHVYLPKKSGKESMRKRALGEIVSPESVDTLRTQETCPQCGNENYQSNSSSGCSLCEYKAPPQEWQDPDTMKSRVLDIIRNNPGPTGKEGKQMPDTTSRLKEALARKRYEEAQRRIADADATTDAARDSDTTDPTKIDQGFTTWDETRAPDDTTDVTKLPTDYKSSAVARRRAQYIQNKRSAFGQDDPTDPAAGATDPTAPGSDGPNSGPPTSDTPGTSDVSGLPITWKQDESGQPYGTVDGTDLDIFVNEDMSWEVLPEGSTDPIAQGNGSSYEDCVQQAFQQAQSIGSQADPSAQGGDPSAQAAPPVDPSADPNAAAPAAPDPTKVSRNKRAQGETPAEAKPDERTDVEKLPDYDTITTDKSQYDSSDYDKNSFEQHNKPVDGSGIQNFQPGGKPFSDNQKQTSRKASSSKVYELVDLYVEHGVVANNRAARLQAMANIENAPADVVQDRINTLNIVSAANANKVERPRSAVPQRAAKVAPNMASHTAAASSSQSDDYLAFIK